MKQNPKKNFIPTPKYDETGKLLPVTRTANIIMRSGTKPVISSVWENRIIEKLKTYITWGDTMFHEHSFNFGELDGSYGKLSESDYIDIAEACKKMIHLAYTVGGGKNVDCVSVFESIRAREGKVTAKFNNALKRYLLQLREGGGWTSLEYVDYRKLSSIYSQSIYEILVSWERTNNNKRWDYSFHITLEELHNKCGTGKKYAIWNNFRHKVLEVTQRELHKKLGYDFWFIPFKDGRKIDRVLFFYNWNSYNEQMQKHYPNKPVQSQNLD